ncbi:MAG: hypothetical protein ABSE92_02210 [Terriglobales bacterium]
MKRAVRMLILMVGVAFLAAPVIAEDGGPIPVHPPRTISSSTVVMFEDGGPIPVHPPIAVSSTVVTFEDGGPIPVHPPK